MLKLLKIGGIGLGLLLFICIVGVNIKEPEYRAAPELTVPTDESTIARGKYLAEHVSVCVECHSKRDWKKYGAPIVDPVGGGGDCITKDMDAPGYVCPANITPHREAGIGQWTDGEISRAIREGVNNRNVALFPMMPYESYRHMSDRDVEAIIAYIKTLTPVDKFVPKAHIEFPVSFFMKFSPQALNDPVPDPPTDSVGKGKYLVRIAGCHSCHSPIDDQHQIIEGREFSGGQLFNGQFGTMTSPNITPHANGIGKFTREGFIQRFKAFENTDQMPTVKPEDNTVMPWLTFAGMTEEDLGAIYDYLQTVPAIDNQVEVKTFQPGTTTDSKYVPSPSTDEDKATEEGGEDSDTGAEETSEQDI